MMKIYAVFSAGLIASTVLGQDASVAVQQHAGGAGKSSISASSEATTRSVSPFNKASSVMQMTVKDMAGKQLGTVKDIVFDLESGTVAYAVISLPGARLVPVPVSALKPGADGNSILLNMSSAVLAAAPAVNNDEWPALDAFSVGAPAGSEKGTGSSSKQN